MKPIRYREFAALKDQIPDFYDSVWFMKRVNNYRWEEYILRSKTAIPLSVLLQAKQDGLLIEIPPKQPSAEIIDYLIENYDSDTFYQINDKMTEILLKRLFGCQQATDSQKVFLKLKYKIDITKW